MVLYTGGLFAGAITIALTTYLLGVLIAALPGHLPQAVRWIAALVAALWALRIGTGRGLPFPSSSWQVPEVWLLTLPKSLTVTLYGFLLGMGILTSVVAPVYWCLLAGSVAYPHLGAILAAWGCYAATRAVMATVGVFRYFDATRNARVPRSTPSSWGVAQGMATVSLLLVAFALAAGI